MPNHITNQITFGTDSDSLAAFQKMLHDVKVDGDPFLTAWSAIPGLMKKLSEKYPEQMITYRWADEEVGYNVGEIVLKGGDIIEDRTPVPGSREAYEMAADIMGTNLAAFHLYLNKDKTNYEYREKPPVETRPQSAKKPKRKDMSR